MSYLKTKMALSSGALLLGSVVMTASAQQASQLFDGQWRYRASCAGCHAEDGSGYYPFGPALKGNPFVQNAPLPALVQVIQQGRNYDDRTHLAYVGMPAFQYLRAGDVEALVAYLKGDLQK